VVRWEATIRGTDSEGNGFEEDAIVENLSSTGAFLAVRDCLLEGARIEVAVKIPLKRENWMSFWGTVVRVADRSGVAVRFDSPRPVFSQL
jgi:spore maturation protein SpmA